MVPLTPQPIARSLTSKTVTAIAPNSLGQPRAAEALAALGSLYLKPEPTLYQKMLSLKQMKYF